MRLIVVAAGDDAVMGATTQQAKRGARRAEDSKPVEALARLGLAARGLIYVVIGLIALQIAFGGGGKADRGGALAAIRDQPFGKLLLVVAAVGFAGYAAWRLLQAAIGHQDADDEKKRVVKRAGSLARGLLYASFAVSTLTFVTSGGGNDKTKPLTARALALPGGQVLVFLVGVAVVGGGVYMAYRGIAKKFEKNLDLSSAAPTTRTIATRSGTVGLLGRGLVFVLLGGFLIDAAVTFDSKKAKGLDAALKTLAQQTFGTVLLIVAALGLLAFGAWSFVEARYRKV